MKIEIEAIESGTNVFVALGYLTAKYGRVMGHRITLDSKIPAVEYFVHWFGSGDRTEEREWFPARQVHLTAEKAFG